MKLKFFTSLLLLVILNQSFGQIVDIFGINLGTSYSNQNWNFTTMDINPGEDYAVGIMAFASVEKKINTTFSVKCDFGFMQKGFKENTVFTTPDGEVMKTLNERVILNNIAFSPYMKINPFNWKISPYYFLGFRTEYLLSYKDATFEEAASGVKFNLHEAILKDFKKFNIGGLIGIGCDFSELLYFELEFNPNFTKNYDNGFLKIKDNCFGAKVGININQLVK